MKRYTEEQFEWLVSGLICIVLAVLCIIAIEPWHHYISKSMTMPLILLVCAVVLTLGGGLAVFDAARALARAAWRTLFPRTQRPRT